MLNSKFLLLLCSFILLDTLSVIAGADSVTDIHVSWQNGKVAEFHSAYTLPRHQFRLNTVGRSSYTLSDRTELSSYLPLLFLPNLSVKHRFFDRPGFAAAYEGGAAVGLIPFAAASGLVLPGAALGVGTVGVFTGSDVYGKLYLSWKPSKKITFSVRGGLSRMHLSYHGIGAFAGAGSGGELIGAVPANFRVLSTTFRSTGAEIDWAINSRNIIVGNISYSNFKGLCGGLLFPSVSFTRAVRKHFHYTVGVYDLLDTPDYHASKLKGSPNFYPFANFYWIFNNGRVH